MHYFGSLVVECFQPPCTYQLSFLFPLSCISFPCSVHVSGRTCYRSIQTYYYSGSSLYGGCLVSQSSQHIEKHSSSLSCCVKSHHGIFQWIESSLVCHCCVCPFGCLDVCVVQTGALFFSLSGIGRDYSSIFEKSLQIVLEGMGWPVCLRGVPKNVISVPKLAEFLAYFLRVGLAWYIVGINCYAISAFLDPCHHHKAPNHPSISKLMNHFYYSGPLT